MVMLIEYIIEILGGLIVDGHLCFSGCVCVCRQWPCFD
jgi:hypothetical protein